MKSYIQEQVKIGTKFKNMHALTCIYNEEMSY